MSLINIISILAGTAVDAPPSGLDNVNIIADGNSYVNGFISPSFPEYIIAAEPFASNGATMLNVGVSGQTTPQMIADQASQVLSQYNGSVNNILLVVEGGNDIYFNGSVSNAITNMGTYCNAAMAVGFKVIVSTTIPREQNTSFGDTESQFNVKLADFNTALVASNFYDGIIRPDLESIFSTYTSGGYNADHIHPNATGQQKLRDLFITAINNLGL